MTHWLTDFSTWFIGLVTSIFSALYIFVHDAIIWLFDGIVSAFASLVAAIPAPSFFTGTSFIGLLNGLPPYPLYVLNQLPIGTCFSIVLSGVVFRLSRKFITIGQW